VLVTETQKWDVLKAEFLAKLETAAQKEEVSAL
jgi:hypothetical protein